MLQNRVDPFGRLVAVAARGTLMGNRGILHDAERRLGVSRWRHRAWVACRLVFRGRHRRVMSPGQYTELFFLDEPTALAAGHRPCGECRRVDFRRFQDAWGRGTGRRPSAPEMDAALHRDRVRTDRSQNTHRAPLAVLPRGAMVALDDGQGAYLWWDGRLWPWSFAGYGAEINIESAACVTVLTPCSTIAALAAGYRPMPHKSLEIAIGSPIESGS